MLPSLLIISPLPPQQTGIAYYTQELITYLKKYYSITTICSEEEITKLNYHSYDRILMHIGNSMYHTHMLDILKNSKAVVVLHDFYLNNLYAKAHQLSRNLLLQEHGFRPIISKNKDYPCNKSLLNSALSVIVHSKYSKELAQKFYYKPSFRDWFTIPILKLPVDKKSLYTKTELGFDSDTFLVSCFGDVTPNKLNIKIIKAWLKSKLHNTKNCLLVFIGKTASNDYGNKFLQYTANNKNIISTGYVNDKIYKSYLSISNLCVQLRTNSRGESSASLLDCLNFGIPTIINRHGTSKDIPESVVKMLNDEFKIKELTHALDELYFQKEQSQHLSQKAKQYVQQNHNANNVSKLYRDTIELSYQNIDHHKKKKLKNLEQQFSRNELINVLTQTTFDSFTQRQVLVDISSIINHDLKTGIQNVVKEQLKQLIKLCPKNTKVIPVYLSKQEEYQTTYYYGYSYLIKLFNLNYPDHITDSPVIVKKDDIFYGLDFCTNEIQKSIDSNIYKQYKCLGVKFIFLVYDLLPISHPEYFLPHIHDNHKKWITNITNIADQFITISHTVKKELKQYTNKPITAIHLGVNKSNQHSIFSKNSSSANKSIHALCVGTVEPRKGHKQLIKAFEVLWNRNIDITLTIVGKVGWNVEPLIRTIKHHPQLNQKLFFLEFVENKKLEELYVHSTLLIAPSYQEGFGLPLIEASFYNLPIIARDIGVFKEVMQEYAYYFKNTKNPKVLVQALNDWIKLYRQNKHPLSSHVSHKSWKANAKRTLKVLL